MTIIATFGNIFSIQKQTFVGHIGQKNRDTIYKRLRSNQTLFNEDAPLLLSKYHRLAIIHNNTANRKSKE